MLKTHYLVFLATLQLSDFNSASSPTYINNTLSTLYFSIKKLECMMCCHILFGKKKKRPSIVAKPFGWARLMG
jgi:hypothetical protein